MSARETAPDVFIGRETELTRVRDVVDLVRGGQAWLVTVEGESGIGKTAVTRQFLSSATGFTVLSAGLIPQNPTSTTGSSGSC